MKKYFFLLCSILFIYSATLFAQITDYELGSRMDLRYRQQVGFYDLSDPDAVNIKVAVWGFVRYPGKYLVPSYTSLLDLLSFAGGPSDDSHLDDIRLYRSNEDGTQEMTVFDFSDIFWESKLDARRRNVPLIEAGDIMVVPGSPKYYARELVSMWSTILSALISITILVLNLVKD